MKVVEFLEITVFLLFVYGFFANTVDSVVRWLHLIQLQVWHQLNQRKSQLLRIQHLLQEHPHMEALCLGRKSDQILWSWLFSFFLPAQFIMLVVIIPLHI